MHDNTDLTARDAHHDDYDSQTIECPECREEVHPDEIYITTFMNGCINCLIQEANNPDVELFDDTWYELHEIDHPELNAAMQARKDIELSRSVFDEHVLNLKKVFGNDS